MKQEIHRGPNSLTAFTAVFYIFDSSFSDLSVVDDEDFVLSWLSACTHLDLWIQTHTAKMAKTKVKMNEIHDWLSRSRFFRVGLIAKHEASSSSDAQFSR